MWDIATVKRQQKNLQKMVGIDMNETQNFKLLRLSGIPENLWNCTLERIPDTLAYKNVIEDRLKELSKILAAGTGFYLWGEYGRGKSAIAAIFLMQVLALGKMGFWVNAKKIPQYAIEKTSWESQTIYERAMEVPLLVIDEFQIRPEIKFQESIVEDWVRERIDAKRSTIITTNISPKQLEKSFPAMHNVVQEAMIPVWIIGKDFRAEIGEQLNERRSHEGV